VLHGAFPLAIGQPHQTMGRRLPLRSGGMNIGEALNAALASHRGNNLPGAKAGYDAVLAAMADNPDALYLRGMIHLVEGELEQGEALTRRAIAAKPDFPEALGNLGRIAAARGKPDLAIQIWQKALRLKPDEAEIRDRLSGVARHYGNLIGCRYGEPFVVKEAMRVDDVMAMGVRSL